MTRILVATANGGKAKEMHNLVDARDVTLISAAEGGILPEVIEDGDTFTDNAVKKACACASANGMPAVADDSGLEVEALGGKPGVFSARYAGENATDEENLQKLLHALQDVPVDNRKARFVCVIAVALPRGIKGTAQGSLCGRIIQEPRGSNGFGYDPVFVPDGSERTLAEMGADEKNRISHRARAIQAACEKELFTNLQTDAQHTD